MSEKSRFRTRFCTRFSTRFHMRLRSWFGRICIHVSKGAVTLEAAIVLPMLLCALFRYFPYKDGLYIYLICCHFRNRVEMASAGYIYQVSGIRDPHDVVEML